MSWKWHKRKSRLSELLGAQGEDEDALALDRILHGQNVIGKTSKTIEIDKLRFTDKDLDVLGTLDRGQFGKIDIVSCTFDGQIYARKSLDKRFVLRNRDQCFPQIERDLLVRAYKTRSSWAPHLLCAFQTPTCLNLVMDFAEGGTLWDVMESSLLDGRISEEDIAWWAPQIVSAINWCHQEGFVHRDIKPHNFVLTKESNLLLIDFGSAAPLLPVQPDGVQLVPKRHCFVPCGTCDYISPEILQAHEEALVALEITSDDNSSISEHVGGYGVEVDWWSFGAMLYEMVYGVTPFFADNIKQTYFKITNHQRHLQFDRTIPVSKHLQRLLQRFLTAADQRLGRRGIDEITNHPFFSGITWSTIRNRPRSLGLHLPQFSYDVPLVGKKDDQEKSQNYLSTEDSDSSRPFAFSAFLESSPLPVSSLQMTPAQKFNRSAGADQTAASFIGFSWGPPLDAFAGQVDALSRQFASRHLTDNNLLPNQIQPIQSLGDSKAPSVPLATPVRPNTLTHHHTLPRTSTVRRTAPRRTVSDREAMKQLVDLVGMSARKKVIESGRKPKILTMSSFPSTKNRSNTLKELRFNMPPADRHSISGDSSRLYTTTLKPPQFSSAYSLDDDDDDDITDAETETEIPPSPSPSPRPCSAMSMSRRSQTPTITGSFGLRTANLDAIDTTRATLHVPTTTMNTLSDAIFDDLEKRYSDLVADISGLHRRLNKLASRVS